MPYVRTSNSSAARIINPFDLGDDPAFHHWCETKIDQYPQTVADLMVEVVDPLALTNAERSEIIRHCRKANMAFYAYRNGNIDCKTTLRCLAEQLGLKNLDGNLCADDDRISSVRVMSTGRHLGYIPYSNRPLNWHTDGYYNQPKSRILAFILHCVQGADRGGDNAFLDPEIAYALLRRENPQYVAALMEPDVMTIPANIENNVLIREAETGPVFSIDRASNRLHMRYTARKRHVEWRQDPVTTAALKFLQEILSGDLSYVIRHRLAAGQGIICNNVLHNRLGFKDSETNENARLLYRARYCQRVVEK